MKNHRLVLLVVLTLLAISALLPLSSVSAYAHVDSYSFTCSGGSVTGTSDQPYVTLYAENLDTGDYYWKVIPVVNGTYSGGATFPEAPEGTWFYVGVWGSPAMYTDIDNDPNYWDGDYDYFWGYVQCDPNAFSGPAVPSSYGMRTITCDTPVYDTPGGQPVGNAAVHVGQTFFVNPVPETAADGSSWTRIFVSSSPNPYIPTSCIQ